MSQAIEINPGDRILVSRTDRLGDLILALPLVETLKLRYPGCRVDVMASLYASPVLENNSNIDGIVRVQADQLKASRRYRRDLEHRLKLADYQVAVVLYPERRISRSLYRIGLPIRIGTAGRFHSAFFTHRLLHSRKANRKHESEYNLDFLKYFAAGPTVHRPQVHPTEKEIENARRLLAAHGVDGTFNVIHPGSGGSAERWPMERFLELYQQLDQLGYRVLVTGSEAEREPVNRAATERGLVLKQVMGETDLRTLAALLSLASLVVANSTGPLHLAVAVGTRVLGLYPGKKVMSPVRWGPMGETHAVIQPDTNSCSCRPGACRCMAGISAGEVKQTIEAMHVGA